MGKISADVPDSAVGVLAGSFTATGQSAGILAGRGLNLTLSGTFVATVTVQRSFDGGTTWHAVFTPDGLVARQFTGPVSLSLWEPEEGVLYRLDCAWTSGEAVYRLSR